MKIQLRKIVLGIFGVVALQTLAPKVLAQDKMEQHPNVLFIIVDDLNDFEGKFGGHPQAITPNIDKLANSGVTFVNGQTNVPVCQPARNSLFTGVYPHDSRDFGWTARKKHDVLKHSKTMFQLFAENGYALYGSGKLMHKNDKKLWNEWGVPERINYGPHAFNGNKIIPHPSVPEPFRSINIVDGSFAPLTDIPQFDSTRTDLKPGWGYPKKEFRYVNDEDRDLMPDEQHADWAVKKLKQLEESGSDKPFFMGIGFVKPHTPLYAPQKYFDMYPLETLKLPVIKEGDDEDAFFKENYPMSQMGLKYYKALCDSYEDDKEGLRKVVQAYLACVTFMDDQVGKVIDALDNSKFADNTIVVFTADHGWNFGQKEYLYKNSPWEESARVPFIVRAPKEQVKGMDVTHPVSLIDLYPTFIDICNLKGSTKLDEQAAEIGGHSIRPFLTDKNATWTGPKGALTVMGVGISEPIEGLAVSVNKQALWHIEVRKPLGPEYVMQQTYSYRTERFRYILYKNGKEELYDHKKDKHEWKNVADKKSYASTKADLKLQMMQIINANSVN
ncbi:sulfatase [Flammeovirga kamogawensis]|uniref:Sulfatase n=1 Tax=Flammeovirga kamogawensis TaxID=373891 RepID=A0ABX8H0D7_9BACT|nr:sulfatase [Flammeovirga kamogawensis]MBB6462246.1 arylsulfatase A-like enzyme [Flammeovirga kamogawensis]QWG09354.1 sulfatase [Flammeovirga kamogawensis]